MQDTDLDKKPVNTRNIVINMLTDTFERGRLSHVVINGTFANEELTEKDRRFITALFTGTLEKTIYLDHIINEYASLKTNKMKPVIRNLLRISLYQLLFMDSVPDRAVLSEALRICEKRKMSGLKGFVNGILRTVQRDRDKGALSFSDLPDHIRYSLPEWMFKKILTCMDEDSFEKYLDAISKDDTFDNTAMTVRIINGYDDASRTETVSMLERDGCSVNLDPELPSLAVIRIGSKLTELEAFKKGRIFVQDKSSYLVSCAVSSEDVDNENNEALIIDVCAAPGGKSIGLADRFRDIKIEAFDISDKKTAMITENIRRLDIDNINVRVHDSSKEKAEFKEKADVVICDLPCSGLGVLKKKPDIRYRLKEDDIDSLAKLQRDILRASSGYVKPGGILIYSTCTVTNEENIENATWFADNTDFKFESFPESMPKTFLTEKQRADFEKGYVQLINGVNDSDGFFIARFRKTG